MPTEQDVLEEINRWLAEAEAQSETTGATREAQTPLPTPPAATSARPPWVGTLIQRSDRDQARKAAIFLTPPPSPPKKRPTRPYERPSPSTRKETTKPSPMPLFQPTGPIPAPPVRVEIEPRIVAEVPHFAIYTARRYKARTPQGRWILWFSRDGLLRYRRKLN